MRIDLNRFSAGEFLSVDDFKNKASFTIREVVTYKFNNRERIKLMLEGLDEKALPINVTNLKILIGKFGDETDRWIGKKITLKQNKNRDEFESSFTIQ